MGKPSPLTILVKVYFKQIQVFFSWQEYMVGLNSTHFEVFELMVTEEEPELLHMPVTVFTYACHKMTLLLQMNVMPADIC